MLMYRPLKNHKGILLAGDGQTLRELWDVIRDVNDRSPLLGDRKSPFLSLAFDIRMAYEGSRTKMPAPDDRPDLATTFGVELLWPTLLVQSRFLRESLSLIDHGKWFQAHTYALEAVIDNALEEAFPHNAKCIKEAWQRLKPRGGMWETLRTRGSVFLGWTSAERGLGLETLLTSFDRDLYQFVYASRTSTGSARQMLSLAELDAFDTSAFDAAEMAQ